MKEGKAEKREIKQKPAELKNYTLSKSYELVSAQTFPFFPTKNLKQTNRTRKSGLCLRFRFHLPRGTG